MPEVCSNFSNLVGNIPRSIRAVFLDLDNTLYTYDPCHNAAMDAVEAYLATVPILIPSFKERYIYAQKVVKERISHQGASHSRLLYFQHIIEEIDPTLVYSLAPALEEVYWETFLTKMEIMPGLIEFLADCAARGPTIVVVSDLTTAIQCKKITTLGIAPYITYLVTSEATGADKPDPAMFTTALKKANVAANEAVMIGDSIEKDIKGARQLGIHAILFSTQA
jgi:HAD superfamily hydrolase (TIGR01509 family)